MADDSRRSSASSRADTPLLQASTALAPDTDISSRDLNAMDSHPELVVGGPPSAPSPLELRAFASQPQKSRFARPVEYHQLELVAPCDKNLCCLICMEPFVNPKRLLCEHTFCDACLSNHIRYAIGQSYSYPGSGARCPTCRRELNMDAEPRAVSRIITNMLDELLVKCPNKAEGCDWEGQRCEAQDHVDFACEHRLVECPARACSQPVMARDLDKGCLHSYVNCEYCEEHVMVIELEAHHLKACPFRMDECHDCSSEVVRKEMDAHRSNDCPKAIINCPAQEFGCDYNCQRDQMDGHKRSCTIAKMLPMLQRMKTRHDDLEAENSQLRRQVSCLEQGLNALQAMVALPPGATAYEVPGAADLTNLNPLADSNNQDLIAQHETLRNEVSRLSNMIAEVEARTNIQLHNEVLRINTDMARTEAALGAMRSQQQWLINARLHALAQMRANAAANASGGSTSNTTAGAATGSTATAGPSSRGTLSPLLPTNALAASSSSSSRPGDYQYHFEYLYSGFDGDAHNPDSSATVRNSECFCYYCYGNDDQRRRESEAYYANGPLRFERFMQRQRELSRQ